jgi:hypothetical protein
VLYVIAQIWLWLALAAILGFIVGWLLRWQKISGRIDQLEDEIMRIRADRDRLAQKNRLLSGKGVLPATGETGPLHSIESG